MKFSRLLICSIVFIVINCFSVFLFLTAEKKLSNEDDELLEYANTIGEDLVARIQREMENASSKIDSISNVLIDEYKTFDDAYRDSINLGNRIEELLMMLPHADGALIAFDNRSSKNNQSPKLFAPYYQKANGCYSYFRIEDYYDYTDANKSLPWYTDAQQKGKASWIGPYLGTVGNKRFVSYSVPARISDSTFFVLTVDYATTDLFLQINGWKSSRIGYPYLMTREGYFIAHPDDDSRSLRAIGENENVPVLITLSDKLEANSPFNPKDIYHRNTISGRDCWEMLFNIGNPDWVLGFSITDHQIYSNPNYFNLQRRKFISLSLFFLFLLLGFELLWVRVRFKDEKERVKMYMLNACTIFLAALFLIFHYTSRYPIVEFSDKDLNQSDMLKSKVSTLKECNESIDSNSKHFDRWNFSMLTDEDRVDDYVEIYNTYSKKKTNDDLIKLPTGLYVQTVKFLDSYSAKLTGYVWQVCPIELVEYAGVNFPDAESYDAEIVDSTLMFFNNGERGVFFRWYFSMEIRETFDYRTFPFDRNNLWLRLWCKDFDSNSVILTPDIGSYLMFHPSYKPGIDPEILIPGWEIEASYFTYKEKNYYSNFGANMNLTKSSYPELHFNIQLKRHFLGPIMTRIIPLLVLLLMTYSILYIAKKEDSLNVAIACSGLLFVAVFEHINLRKTLDASGIIYMEYFYFITYLLLVLVSVNVIIDGYMLKLKKRSYLRQNFLEMTYWLIALFTLLLITIINFY